MFWAKVLMRPIQEAIVNRPVLGSRVGASSQVNGSVTRSSRSTAPLRNLKNRMDITTRLFNPGVFTAQENISLKQTFMQAIGFVSLSSGYPSRITWELSIRGDSCREFMKKVTFVSLTAIPPFCLHPKEYRYIQLKNLTTS
jgi:hypothetical protein